MPEQPEGAYSQALSDWDIDRLLTDLASTTQKRYKKTARQDLLCLLLNGSSLRRISEDLHKAYGVVRSNATDIYRDIEELTGEQENSVKSGNLIYILEKHGYRKNQLLHQLPRKLTRDLNSQTTLPTPDLNFVGREEANTNLPQEETEALYVERPPIEFLCYEKLLQPGSLIRIKASKGMGKTRLIDRILVQAANQGYRTVRLSLLRANEATIENLDKFLPWFCTSVGRQLQKYHRVDNFEWDGSLGSNDNCTAYLEECLLANIDRPLVLGLDNVDRVFPHFAVAQDFFPLLRAWHEDGKIIETWKKLRLLVAYSTEVYIPLNIDQSPFNVGQEIDLPEFSEEQVQNFAEQHQLNCSNSQVKQLRNMLGGHPFLVQQALSHLKSIRDSTVEQFLQAAPTEAGIYRNHLREHFKIKIAHRLILVEQLN